MKVVRYFSGICNFYSISSLLKRVIHWVSFLILTKFTFVPICVCCSFFKLFLIIYLLLFFFS